MSTLITKAKALKLLILDVDGVLTTGAIYYGSDGFEMKGFHIHDGLGLKLLQQAGLLLAIISGKKSEAVARRLQELNIQHIYLGFEDKLPIYEKIKQELGLQDHEIAYMGDDLPDLPVLNEVGFAVAVSNAVAEVKKAADYVTEKRGGHGAVREVVEMILNVQGKWPQIVADMENSKV